MSEEQTKNLDDGRSFEERVFARFDALDARLTQMDSRLANVELRLTSVEARLEGMDGRLQVLEQKAYDTKPIWERALRELSTRDASSPDGLTASRQWCSKPASV